MYTSRGDALAGAHYTSTLRPPKRFSYQLRTLSQERVRRSGAAALTLAARMQRLHSAAARRFLGPEYEDVIRYTIADAFADGVKPETLGRG
jgi:hypothetical protein